MKRRQNEREKGRRVENSEDGRRRRTVRYRPRVEHGERQRTRKTRNEIRERQMGREADGERGWQGGGILPTTPDPDPAHPPRRENSDFLSMEGLWVKVRCHLQSPIPT